jgi:TolB-like protein/Flp pilus assembly protein TadD
MSSEPERHPKVEIAHVLTMDVVEYSTLLITEQMRVMGELTSIVKNTERFQHGESEGKLVRIPTGDGMALVFFDDPQAPIECAMEIAAALKSHSEIRLRMGIHSGPVNAVVDVIDRANVAGAGIDNAQRVIDCGDAGHILFSKSVADDLAPFPRWNPYLHELGECEVKHGRKVSLVNFYTGTVGNPQTPKKCALAKTKPLLPSQRALIAATVLLVIAVGFLWLVGTFRWDLRGRRGAASLPAKSIAVLPFENLSRDPENTYFADGIQEEILSRLSKIADLKVISRTSTQRYKSKPANLSEIANQLGVAHVLEGTVQKAADQVRVNVQLINALNDSHVWADKYDRRLADIFAVESEIAANIASALEAKLSGAERRAVTARPTENTEAHELYLRGRYFWGKRTEDGFRKALDHFQQAVALDPSYAQAYVGIADCYVLLFAWGYTSADESFPKAEAAASKALQLDSQLGEAHASLAEIFANEVNLREARREGERAIELAPNYATAHHWLGIDILSPLGQHDRAIAELRRAVEIDPFSAIINTNLGYSYILARRYTEAIAQLRKTVELDPNFDFAHSMLGDALTLTGQFDEAIAEHEKAYHLRAPHDPPTPLVRMAYTYAMKGDREKALAELNQAIASIRGPYNCAFGRAVVHIALGDKNEALNWLEQSYRDKESAYINMIKVHPFLDPLRGDSRFEKLANQIVPPDLK